MNTLPTCSAQCSALMKIHEVTADILASESMGTDRKRRVPRYIFSTSRNPSHFPRPPSVSDFSSIRSWVYFKKNQITDRIWFLFKLSGADTSRTKSPRVFCFWQPLVFHGRRNAIPTPRLPPSKENGPPYEGDSPHHPIFRLATCSSDLWCARFPYPITTGGINNNATGTKATGPASRHLEILPDSG